MNWFNRHDYHSGRYEQLANEMLRPEGSESACEEGDDDNLRWFGRTTNRLAVVYLLSHLHNRQDDQSDESAMFEDRTSRSPAANMMDLELTDRLHRSVDSLSTDAAGLIRATYFDGLSLTEASTRLGISKSWASRLHARALEELARSLAEAV